MGGILHALKIPITGFVIGGFAVLFISLIAYYSESKKEIIKATIIVIIIKFIASPHTPITAYFSVFIQGFLGYLLFSLTISYRLSALLLGIITLLISSVQKIIIYTIIFGYTLWDSINLFYDYLISKILPSSEFFSAINFSYTIITIYVLSHILGGILFGYFAGKLPEWIENNYSKIEDNLQYDTINFNSVFNKNNQRSKWKQPIRILFYSLIIIMLALPYLLSELSTNNSASAIFLILRVSVILFIWYKFLLPISTKLLKSIIKKKKSQYSKEVEHIISQFPLFKLILINSIHGALQFSGLTKVKMFLIYLFVLLIKVEFSVDE